jgi:hypothetical protein
LGVLVSLLVRVFSFVGALITGIAVGLIAPR